MSTPPPPSSPSRPPPVDVQPVEHRGVRYVQDRGDPAAGDQNGGYLVAEDAATGERLWRIRVYKVETPPPGLSPMGRYFRSMQLVPGEETLEIANESGGRYRIDLHTREVTSIGLPESAEPAPRPQKPTPPKPKPKPKP